MASYGFAWLRNCNFQAMVSASRWARAHDLLVRWFVRAKAKRPAQRALSPRYGVGNVSAALERIKCAEADLSDEVPSACS